MVLRAGLVQVLAAHRAEPCAVLPADDLSGKSERQGVARPGMQVELVALDVLRAQLVDSTRLVDLAGVDLDPLAGRLETAHAGPVELGGKAEPQRVPIGRVVHVEDHVDLPAGHVVALPTELEPVNPHDEIEPPPLTGREPEPAEVE